jgi:hypothetical protein
LNCKEGAAFRKNVKKHCGDNSLPRKFDAWKEANHELVANLAVSVFDPLDRNRLNNILAYITIKEIKGGFRVVSAKEMNVRSLPKCQEITVNQFFIEHKKDLEDLKFRAIFRVESMSGKSFDYLGTFILGELNDLPQISIFVAELKILQDQIINELNKEG